MFKNSPKIYEMKKKKYHKALNMTKIPSLTYKMTEKLSNYPLNLKITEILIKP